MTNVLRVGLTGDLGSGKSTVAAMLAARGAHVMSSDDMARAMMQPGEPVYAAIIAHFGDGVLQSSPADANAETRALDRQALARLAFAGGRVEDLNAIIHPPVIAEQARRMAALAETDPHAIAVVESALLLSTKHANGPWHERFDEVVMVTAPEAVKIARFVSRAVAQHGVASREMTRRDRIALEADAMERLRVQREATVQDPDAIVLRNDGDLAALTRRVDTLWLTLWRKANR